MIVSFIIEFAMFVVRLFLNLIFGVSHTTTDFDLFSALGTILALTDQVKNFAYFLFGDNLPIAYDMAVFSITLKYVITPLVSFVRKIFVWG